MIVPDVPCDGSPSEANPGSVKASCSVTMWGDDLKSALGRLERHSSAVRPEALKEE